MFTQKLAIITLLIISGMSSCPSITELADRIPALLSVSTQTQKADVVVVFAGGGGKRIRHAATLVEAGLAKSILILGTEPEKECALSILDKWFPGNSVDILLPECALPNTKTSAQFACKLLSQSSMNSAIVVSDQWHLRRISLLMKQYGGSSCSHLAYSAPVKPTTTPWWKNVDETWNVSTECIKLAGCAIMSLV